MRVREVINIPELKGKDYYYCFFCYEREYEEFTKKYPWFTEEYYDRLETMRVIVIEHDTKAEGEQIEILGYTVLQRELTKDIETKSAILNDLNLFVASAR